MHCLLPNVPLSRARVSDSISLLYVCIDCIDSNLGGGHVEMEIGFMDVFEANTTGSGMLRAGSSWGGWVGLRWVGVELCLGHDLRGC